MVQLAETDTTYREPEVTPKGGLADVTLKSSPAQKKVVETLKKQEETQAKSFEEVMTGLYDGTLDGYGSLPKVGPNKSITVKNSKGDVISQLSLDSVLNPDKSNEEFVENLYRMYMKQRTLDAPNIPNVEKGTTNITAPKGTDEWFKARDQLNVVKHLENSNITDSLIQEIMVDKFHTGNFYTSGMDRLKEVGRIPYYILQLGTLLYSGASSQVQSALGYEGLTSDVIYGENVRSREQNANNVRFLFEDILSQQVGEGRIGVLPVTRETLLNERVHGYIKEYLVNKHGEKRGMEIYQKPYGQGGYMVYNPEDPSKSAPALIFDADSADRLYNYAFGELPFAKKAGLIIGENATLAALLTRRASKTAIAQARKEEKLRKANPKKYHLGVSPRQVLKMDAIENSNLGAVGKFFQELSYKPGDWLNFKGSVELGKNELLAKAAVKDLNKDIAEATTNLKTLTPNSTEFIKQKTTLDNLIARRTRMTFVRPDIAISPMLMGTLKTELAISLGQTLGAEFAGDFGYSPETGEVIGALSVAFNFHKLGTVPLKYVGRKADDMLYNTISEGARDTVRFLENLSWMPLLKPGMIIDRSTDQLDTYLKSLKNKDGTLVKPNGLTIKERRSFKLLTDLTERLTPKDKDKMQKALNEVFDVRSRIINKFSADEQEEVSQLYNMSFAAMTNMPVFEAIKKIGTGKLSAFDLGRSNWSKVTDSIEHSEKTLNQGMFAIRELRKRADNIGDPVEGNKVKALLDGREKRLLSAKEQLKKEENIYLNMIQEYKKYIIHTPDGQKGSEISEGVLEDLFQMELELLNIDKPISTDQIKQMGVIPLNKGATAQEIVDYSKMTTEARKKSVVLNLADQRKQLDKFVFEMYEQLSVAYDNVASMKGSELGSIQEAQLLEKFFELELFHNNMLAKQGFKKYDAIAKMEGNIAQVQIQDKVIDFFKEQKKVDNKPLYKQFAKGGRFFGGAQGRAVSRVFRKIANTSLNDYFARAAKATDDELEADDIKGEVIAIFEKEFDIKGITDIELFTMLMDDVPPQLKGILPDDIEIPIVADYFEIEEMQRHFRDIAQRTKSEEEAKVIEQFSDGLLEILESDQELFPLLKEARQVYQRNKFDKLRDKGYANSIIKNRQGPLTQQPTKKITENDVFEDEDSQKELLGAGYTKFLWEYSPGTEPTFWHTRLIDQMGDFLEIKKPSTDPADYKKVSSTWEDMHTFWTDAIELPTGEILNGFDLRKKHDRLKLSLFRKMLTGNFINLYYRNRIKTLKAKQPKIFRDIDNYKNPVIADVVPLDSDRLEKFQIMEDTFTVTVIDQQGNISKRKMTDIESVLLSEQDITKILVKDENSRNIYSSIQKEFGGTVEGNLNRALKNRLDKDQRLMQDLFDTIGAGVDIKKGADFQKASFDFFKKYIVDGDVGDLDDLRDLLTGKTIDKGFALGEAGKITPKYVFNKKELDNIIATIVSEGLFQYAEHGMLPNKKMTLLDGTIGAPSGFTDQGVVKIMGLLDSGGMLVNEATSLRFKENLRSAIGIDNAELTEDFFKFLGVSQTSAGLENLSIEGLLRNVSPNELVSRGFNLARGMVSPAYVAAELYLRIATANQIDVMKLAVTNDTAGEMLMELIKNPKGFNVRYDATSLVSIIKEFVFTELVRQQKTRLADLDMEALEALYVHNLKESEEKENEDL